MRDFFFLGLFFTANSRICGCTTADSHIQTLLQNSTITAASFGPVCCNFRASVFVYPIIDCILVLKLQQVIVVGTDLANFCMWNHKSKHQRQSLVVK